MDMDYRLFEALLVSSLDHKLGSGEPAVAVLPTDFAPVYAAREWPPQHLGQLRDRQQNRKRVAVDKHQARIRIHRAKRAKGKDVIGAFEHPVSGDARLMLQVLQEALVKTIGVEVSSFIEPAAIARNMIGRIETQAREHMRGDLRALLRRGGIDRVHAPKLRRQHAEHT